MLLIIINGPTLNLLSKWEPDIYGTASFEDYLVLLRAKYPEAEIAYFQSNHEGDLIDKLHETGFTVDGLIIYNHSEFTTTLVLKKPDIVAPFPPFVSNITPGEKSIIIEWAASMTGDVVEHALYRRADGETDWKAIANIKDRSVNSFTDSTAVGETLYQYSLDAADDAGLRSERSNIVDAQLVAATERSGVQGLVGQFDQASKHVVVRWNATDGAAEYYLYKAIGDAEPTLYRSVANTKEAREQ